MVVGFWGYFDSWLYLFMYIGWNLEVLVYCLRFIFIFLIVRIFFNISFWILIGFCVVYDISIFRFKKCRMEYFNINVWLDFLLDK